MGLATEGIGHHGCLQPALGTGLDVLPIAPAAACGNEPTRLCHSVWGRLHHPGDGASGEVLLRVVDVHLHALTGQRSGDEGDPTRVITCHAVATRHDR